jgi:hypothetical protein
VRTHKGPPPRIVTRQHVINEVLADAALKLWIRDMFLLAVVPLWFRDLCRAVMPWPRPRSDFMTLVCACCVYTDVDLGPVQGHEVGSSRH